MNIILFTDDSSSINKSDKLDIDHGDSTMYYYTNTNVLSEFTTIFEEAMSCIERLQEAGFKVLFGSNVGFLIDIYVYDESNEVK